MRCRIANTSCWTFGHGVNYTSENRRKKPSSYPPIFTCGKPDAILSGPPIGSITVSPCREAGILLTEALSAFSSQPLGASQLAALQARHRDLLMAGYVAALARTQAAASERINHIL